MTEALNSKIAELIKHVCDDKTQMRLIQLFEEKPALYAPMSESVREHICFATIKLALQGEVQLKRAEKLYLTDTRDLLVNAEFASSLNAHEEWFSLCMASQRQSE